MIHHPSYPSRTVYPDFYRSTSDKSQNSGLDFRYIPFEHIHLLYGEVSQRRKSATLKRISIHTYAKIRHYPILVSPTVIQILIYFQYHRRRHTCRHCMILESRSDLFTTIVFDDTNDETFYDGRIHLECLI